MKTDPFQIVRRPSFSQQFQPQVRGDFSASLKDTTSLSIIRPQSPRPAEMLVGCEYDFGGVDFTATDHSISEALITRAYDADPKMLKTSYEIPLSDLLHLVGPDARPDAIEASLKRIQKVLVSFHGTEDRTYRDVQLITTWKRINPAGKEIAIGFQFPDPIRELMRTMPRYAYIEHAALAQGNMTSRYSAMMYKMLAFEVSKNPWKPNDDNRFTVSVPVEELADMLQLPRVKGRVNFSRLRARVLEKLGEDLKAVQKFSVTVTFDGKAKPKTGRTVEMIDFNVVVHADYHRVTSSKRVGMTPELEKVLKNVEFGAPDAPELRLPSNFWRRVVRNKGMKCLQLLENHVHPVWITALQEAIDADPMSEHYHIREFRGAKLLEAINRLGVQEAAWQFFAEEAALGADVVRSPKFHERLPKARRAQLERYRMAKMAKAAKWDEASIPLAAHVSSEPEVQGAPMPVTAHVERMAGSEVVAFEDCTHIEITAEELEVGVIENMVIERLEDRIWGNGPRRTLRIRYLSGGGWASHDIDVTPEDEDEVLHQIKRSRAAPYIDGAPLYLRVTK